MRIHPSYANGGWSQYYADHDLLGELEAREQREAEELEEQEELTDEQENDDGRE